jgi:hypothetical protein
MKIFYKLGMVLFALFLFSNAYNQTISQNFSVRLSVVTETNPPSISVLWNAVEGATEYRVYRKSPTSLDWGSPGAVLGPGDIGITDSGVMPGQVYEYKVEASRGTAPMIAYGYVLSGIQVSATENRGGIILVVDNTFTASLEAELNQLQMDLVGDGYTVYRLDVDRTSSAMLVRSRIQSIYNNNPDILTALLVGHVPVPYSGNYAPDGHIPDHEGAWSTDGFYADIDGTWTDNTINNAGATRVANQNVPGDGKYDQIFYPSPIDLQLGRIDFSDLPAFPESEEELLRQYLNKLHEFKHGRTNVVMGGVIDDNFATMPEGFAQNGWRNFGPLVGFPNTGAGDYFTNLNANPFIWSYGCGGGSYTSCSGVGTTTDFVNNDPMGIFTMLFGSYFGDWDSQNNLLRSALASGNTLTNVWAGRPNWYFHHMGMNESIGLSAWLTQNNLYLGSVYLPEGVAPSTVHTSLMGDPTLRMFNIPSPTFTSIYQNGGNVEITWMPGDTGVIGHRLYRATDPMGPYEVVVNGIITSNSWIDSCVAAGTYYYQLRPFDLNGSASGTFFNLGTGVFEQFTVEDNPAMVETFTGMPSCPGDADATIGISMIDNAALPYTLMWSTGSSSDTLSGLAAGDYTFTITDFCGKETTGTLTVEDPDPIQVNASSTDETSSGANDGTANAAPSGGDGNYTYEWSNGETTPMISGLTPGDYTVTVTDGNGCKSTASVNVAGFGCDLSVATNTFNAACNGGMGSVVYSVSGGTPPYTFTENPPGDYPAGTYTYTLIDDNDCELSGSFTITEPDPVTTGMETVVNPTCPNDTDGSISIDPQGGSGNFTVNWSTGDTGNSISGLTSGDYTVTVIDDNNCRTTATYSISGEDVTPPSVNVIGNLTLELDADGLGSIMTNMVVGGTADNCGNVTLSISQMDFDCDDIGQNTITITAQDDAGNITTEDVIITVIDSEVPVLSCPSSMMVDGCEEVVTYNMPIATDNCSVNTPVLTSGMASGSTFSSGSTTVSFEVTDQAGNVGTCSFFIQVNPTFEFQSSAVSDVACNGDQDGAIDVSISGGTANLAYSWSNGATTEDLSGLSGGTYTVTITDGSCTYEDTYTVEEPEALEPEVSSITDETSAGNDGAININTTGGVSPYTFVWQDENGNQVSTDEDPTGLTAGIYSVTVTDGNGCEAILTGIEVDKVVGTSSVDFPGSWNVYPNPARESLSLELELNSAANTSIRMYNSNGLLMNIYNEGFARKFRKNINLDNYPAGVYLMEVVLDDARYFQKVVVMP